MTGSAPEFQYSLTLIYFILAEPIQSRCAVLRYTKLTDAQVLARLQEVCQAEDVSFTDDGIEAVIFTAQGDMRQALNNLQSTFQGFGHVNSENVFKVCQENCFLLVSFSDCCLAAIWMNKLKCFLGYTDVLFWNF